MDTILIGDSHSQLHFNYIMELVEGLNPIERHSKPGWGSKSYLESDLLDALPSAATAIVALGGNNQELNDSFDQRVSDLLKRLGQAGISNIVWLGPFWSDPAKRADVLERHEWTNERLKQILPGNVAYIEMMEISKDTPTTDGVHFSASRYKEMIQRLLPWLQSEVSGVGRLFRFSRWWLLSGSLLAFSAATVLHLRDRNG